MNIKGSVPWQIKILVKILLDRVPLLPRGFWAKIGFVRHGPVSSPEYAFNVFNEHYAPNEFPNKSDGFIGLELGPGYTLFSAAIACGLNASAFYLVDVGSFARFDKYDYLKMANYISNQGLPFPKIGIRREEFLKNCKSEYLTKGMASLKTIPGNLVDFAFSQAVLEHIPLDEFQETQQELFRVLKPGGVCSHAVDLKDHLSYALNNLRFSEKAWEKYASSSFYTNRLRYSEMIRIFETVGYEIEYQKISRWKELPTAKNKLAKHYQLMKEDELLIKGFSVVLRKPLRPI